MSKLQYIQDAYNTISLVLAKNDEFVPKSWKADLERFVANQDTLLETIAKEMRYEFQVVRDNNGRIVELNDDSFKYARVNSNPEYVNYLMDKNKINTIEKLETRLVSWTKIAAALKIADDVLTFGYDDNMQYLYGAKYFNSDNVTIGVCDARKNVEDALKFINSVAVNSTKATDSSILNCLSVNKDLFENENIKLDEEYYLLDTSDMMFELGNKLASADNVSLVNTKALDGIANGGQYFITTDRWGDYYLPIIKTTDGEIKSFIDCEHFVEELKVEVETYTDETLTMQISDITDIEMMDFVDRCDFRFGQSYTKKEKIEKEDSDMDNERD